MKNLKNVCALGILTALYVVFSLTCKIPLIGHIGTDLGYVVFAVALYYFGVPAAAVGVLGCLIESLLVSGWIPYGWIAGQLLIGIFCGYIYKNYNSKILQILTTAVMVFVGIAVVKTLIECKLFGIPLEVKFVKNSIAAIADFVPMAIGLVVSWIMKKRAKI